MITVLVGSRCPVCGANHTVETDMKNAVRVNRYFNGQIRISDLADILSPAEREILITGIGAKCWDLLFTEDEE